MISVIQNLKHKLIIFLLVMFSQLQQNVVGNIKRKKRIQSCKDRKKSKLGTQNWSKKRGQQDPEMGWMILKSSPDTPLIWTLVNAWNMVTYFLNDHATFISICDVIFVNFSTALTVLRLTGHLSLPTFLHVLFLSINILEVATHMYLTVFQACTSPSSFLSHMQNSSFPLPGNNNPALG